jgi:uncharacterized protein YdeI (YjbR/CyaY-like superfamily)
VTKPVFFATAAAFRRWLEEHHDDTAELQVGYHKKESGRPSITYKESVDEALCFGWIDGVRRGIDDGRYTVRFTPRRKGSVWSLVNTRRMEELLAAGRVAPAGRAAFLARDPKKSEMYSYEQRHVELGAEEQARLDALPAVRAFWDAQPPGYRRLASHFVMSAKQEATRRRRMDRLLAACRRRQRL